MDDVSTEKPGTFIIVRRTIFQDIQDVRIGGKSKMVTHARCKKGETEKIVRTGKYKFTRRQLAAVRGHETEEEHKQGNLYGKEWKGEKV